MKRGTEWRSANGTLRTFRLTACRCVGAGPRAVSRRGLGVAALACGEGALRCSLREGGCDAAVGAAERGTHLTASRRPGGYAGLPLAALRCSPAHMRPGRTPPSGPGTRCFLRRVEYKLPVSARLRVGRSGRELSAPRSAAWSGLPAARRRDGEDCRAPLPAQRAKGRVPQPPSRSEQRRGAGPQGRPSPFEHTGLPARSLARADARTHAFRTLTIVANGSQSDIRGRIRFMRRGSHAVERVA
jgi:hypothetical protein